MCAGKNLKHHEYRSNFISKEQSRNSVNRKPLLLVLLPCALLALINSSYIRFEYIVMYTAGCIRRLVKPAKFQLKSF
jgi:hypothetical protein